MEAIDSAIQLMPLFRQPVAEAGGLAGPPALARKYFSQPLPCKYL